MYVSVVNMSKSCCFAFVLAVICLSLETDAQPTVDETMTCSSSTLEEVVNKIASNQQQNAREIKDEIKAEIKDKIEDVKKMISSETNETTLEEVSEQIKNEIGLLSDKITNLKQLMASGNCEIEPSKQALVSALVSNCVPLLIQQNVNGSNFFNRSWAEFKLGFNDSIGNYWLGNELLSQLTVNHRYKLKFDLQSRSNKSNWYHAEYSTFRVLPETYNYELLVHGYSGNAGFDALSHSNGAMFTTYDRDNDQRSGRNCAVQYSCGAFWYKNCFHCGVNCVRSRGYFYWWSLPGGRHLQSSRMWLQCK